MLDDTPKDTPEDTPAMQKSRKTKKTLLNNPS